MPDDPTLKLIHFSRADLNQMQNINICRTPYGIIQRNDRKMTPEYSNPRLGQQML